MLVIGEKAFLAIFYLLRFPHPHTHRWFKKAREKDLLRNLDDLKNIFNDSIESIKNYYEDEFNIGKKEIWNHIFKNLNASLFLVGASTDRPVSFTEIDGENKKLIEERAGKTIEKVLTDINSGKPLTQGEKKLAEEIVKELTPSSGPLYVKFPTGFLARQFTSKRFSEDLNDLFDNFSYFSHSFLS